jgi:hypothetical protein
MNKSNLLVYRFLGLSLLILVIAIGTYLALGVKSSPYAKNMLVFRRFFDPPQGIFEVVA